MAAAATIPNNIVDTTVNDAARPMANWNAILTWMNANAVHLDGAKAMTGTLSGPAGVDPVSANEYSRKAYVDTKSAADVAAEAAIRAAADLAPAKFGASITLSPAQSIPNASPTTLTFNVETWDTDAYFTGPGTNILIPSGKAGVYLISVVTFGSWSPSTHGTTVFLNGNALASTTSTFPTSGPLTQIATITLLRAFAALDVLVVQVSQVSGSAQNVTGAVTLHRISA